MKRRLCFVVLSSCLLLAASPATGQTVYNNGPINGDSDGWTINSGFVVSDSFTVSQGTSHINGIVFGDWIFPGDILESVEVSITSQEFGGTTYFDQQVNFTASDCGANSYGYDVCTETGTFNGPTLGNGTYWLNLQNAIVNNGDPVYWDENSGHSTASENSIGTIPSESFTVLGSSSTTTTTGTVPEPGSILLLGSGVLGMAGVLRRKLL
jgi:hypothetical protein